MLTAITGINWGDEGKGRMVDLLSENYDIVVRYQGGNNAGHTVVNPSGKFILNLLPSGITRPDVINVMGNGMVIDLEHLCEEIARLRACGIEISPDTLKISNQAVICLPFHVQLDVLEENRLGEKKFGSTRRGIAPVYGDKYMKRALRMGELLHPAALRNRLDAIVEWKNLTVEGGYKAEAICAETIVAWLEKFGAPLRDYITDTGIYLDTAEKTGKKILFEAQLGALRDVDFGIYPYTSSCSTIAAFAPIGAGIPNHKLSKSVGIMKAYSTCVGEGPFTCEMFGEEADELRREGNEFGAATGRARRVGAFDSVASKYGVRIQGAEEIALTKLDVLSYLKKIPICVGYQIGEIRTTEFITGPLLNDAKPIFDYLDGWECDISKCRKLQDLPPKAMDYIHYLERAVGCRITYVSVGPARDQYIVM